MSRVYLCLGKTAEDPWYFERSRVHVYTVEELCYFIKENIWLLPEGTCSSQLADWVGEQCGLSALRDKLLLTLKDGKGAEGFCEILFSETGYYGKRELEEVKRQLRCGSGVTDNQKQKARADYYLESGRYTMALSEYGEIIRERKGIATEFLGKTYHNQGIALAKLFLFEKAAASFEMAYKMTGNEECRISYLASLRLSMTEEEYLSFLVERPELHNISLKLEERVEQCVKSFRCSKQWEFLSRALEAKQNGAYEICDAMTEQKAVPFQEKYRELAQSL